MEEHIHQRRAGRSPRTAFSQGKEWNSRTFYHMDKPGRYHHAMRKEPDPKGRMLGDSTEGQDPCHLMGTELQIEEKVLQLDTSACNSYQDKGQEVPAWFLLVCTHSSFLPSCVPGDSR